MKKGAGLFIICEKSKKCLLLLRSKNCTHPFTWSICGGLLDPGEEILDCAKRECFEEIGYDSTMKIEFLSAFKSDNFEFHSFLALVPKQFKVNLDLKENSDYLWTTKSELLNIDPKHFGLIEILQNKKCLKKIDNYMQ